MKYVWKKKWVVHNYTYTEAVCIFIGLRQIIKLGFDINTNIQKSWWLQLLGYLHAMV